MRVPPTEIIDTPEQKLYTDALGSKRIRRRHLHRIRLHHNFNKGELTMGGDIIKGGEPPKKKKAKKKAAPKKAAKKKAAKK
jgi:hypothetical protein